jgi:hypothetical protein
MMKEIKGLGKAEKIPIPLPIRQKTGSNMSAYNKPDIKHYLSPSFSTASAKSVHSAYILKESAFDGGLISKNILIARDFSWIKVSSKIIAAVSRNKYGSTFKLENSDGSKEEINFNVEEMHFSFLRTTRRKITIRYRKQSNLYDWSVKS